VRTGESQRPIVQENTGFYTSANPPERQRPRDRRAIAPLSSDIIDRGLPPLLHRTLLGSSVSAVLPRFRARQGCRADGAPHEVRVLERSSMSASAVDRRPGDPRYAQPPARSIALAFVTPPCSAGTGNSRTQLHERVRCRRVDRAILATPSRLRALSRWHSSRHPAPLAPGTLETQVGTMV